MGNKAKRKYKEIRHTQKRGLKEHNKVLQRLTGKRRVRLLIVSIYLDCSEKKKRLSGIEKKDTVTTWLPDDSSAQYIRKMISRSK